MDREGRRELHPDGHGDDRAGRDEATEQNTESHHNNGENQQRE